MLVPGADDPAGDRGLAFQLTELVPAADLEPRPSADLGGTVLYDRSEDPDEPLYVFADPMGHPFCIFVG